MVSVTDDTTLKLLNLTVHVGLSSEQVADDSLSSALLAFRRAANTLAQNEDDLVFNGRGESRYARKAARWSLPLSSDKRQASIVVKWRSIAEGPSQCPHRCANAGVRSKERRAAQHHLQPAGEPRDKR